MVRSRCWPPPRSLPGAGFRSDPAGNSAYLRASAPRGTPERGWIRRRRTTHHLSGRPAGPRPRTRALPAGCGPPCAPTAGPALASGLLLQPPPGRVRRGPARRGPAACVRPSAACPRLWRRAPPSAGRSRAAPAAALPGSRRPPGASLCRPQGGCRAEPELPPPPWRRGGGAGRPGSPELCGLRRARVWSRPAAGRGL